MQLRDLYGVNASMSDFKKRVTNLENRFESLFSKKPKYLFSSSGRAEIIGNHTDHNHGKVIVSAISCDVLASVEKTDDEIIKIYSLGFDPFSVNVNDTKINQSEYGKSIALVKGVVKAIKDRGYKVGGFNMVADSNIFRGAGVSSSAAFELLICEVLNVLYLDCALNKVEKAMISQYSENVYFGKPCGLLDQSGISLGGLNKIDFNIPTEPVIENLTSPEGYTLVITNTGGSHSALTEHYSDIRREMQSVADYFGKKVLREISFEEFFASISEIRKRVSERAVLRAFHFFEENERVDNAAKALSLGCVDEFLNAISESGKSSLNCLQNCFIPGSCEQPISLAIRMSERLIKNGAVRVHGGGFAGTIIAYISDLESEKYIAEMSKVFGEENVFCANVRKLGATSINMDKLI